VSFSLLLHVVSIRVYTGFTQGPRKSRKKQTTSEITFAAVSIQIGGQNCNYKAQRSLSCAYASGAADRLADVDVLGRLTT